MNYMKQVAEMLGVEFGEEFRVIYPDGTISESYYTVNDNGVMNTDNLMCNAVLRNVLTGECLISKLSWKPVNGQEYYMPSIENGHADYCGYVWSGNHTCKDRYNSGLVCKTMDEAIEKAEDILEYTGRLNWGQQND